MGPSSAGQQTQQTIGQNLVEREREREREREVWRKGGTEDAGADLRF